MEEPFPLAALPTHALANVLEQLGQLAEDAGAVMRAASACRALWAAAAGPFHKVHQLVLHTPDADLPQRVLVQLKLRFPAVRELRLACSWHYTGARSLPALSSSLTTLVADDTSLPLLAAPTAWAAVLPEQPLPEQLSLPTCLQRLQLRRLVQSAVKCRTHGSSEDCQCKDDTLLAALLQHSAQLTSLDLQGNTSLPSRLLHAAAATAACTNLASLSLRNCALVCLEGAICEAFPRLTDLDVSGTASSDADVAHLASRLHHLTSLRVRGCRRVSDAGLRALAEAPAVLSGRLLCLDLGGLTRTSSAALGHLLHTWVGACSRHSRLRCGSSASGSSSSNGGGGGAPVLLQLGLSRTSGVTDAVLFAFIAAEHRTWEQDGAQAVQQQQQLEPWQSASCDVAARLEQLVLSASATTPAAAAAAPERRLAAGACATGAAATGGSTCQPAGAPPVALACLELAGCNGVTSSLLLQLGEHGVLQHVTCLDFADCEALRKPGPEPSRHRASNSATGAAQAAPAPSSSGSGSVLAPLLALCGRELQLLVLDGCVVEDSTAATLATQQALQQLTQLSLVGCRGLSSSGMRRLLLASPCLSSLAIGGAMASWSEGEVLPGLPCLSSLTQLKLLRRPVLRDAELAAVLAGAAQLQSLSLVGGHMLTDTLWELATQQGAGQGEQQAQQQLKPSCSTVGGSGGPVRHMGVAAGASSPCAHARVPALAWHLTQLSLTACDSLHGGGIARLRGLRHLRVAFCASFSDAAVQQLAVGCSRLALLELPASLQRKLPAYTVFRFGEAAAAAWPAAAGHRAGGAGGDHRGVCGRPMQASAPRQAPDLLMPHQGLGDSWQNHLHSLKVVWH